MTAGRLGSKIVFPPSLPAGTRLFTRGNRAARTAGADSSKTIRWRAKATPSSSKRGGFRVAQCESAEDAYSRSLELVPDVVVTDIALPGRDGFSLAADLRVQTRTRSIPVVAMTAYWAADVHERADRAGMTSILMKPCQPDHLIAELHRVLRSSQLPRVLDAHALPPLPHARKPEVKPHS